MFVEEGEIKCLLTLAADINTDDTGLYYEFQSVRKRPIKAVFYPQLEQLKSEHEHTQINTVSYNMYFNKRAALDSRLVCKHI